MQEQNKIDKAGCNYEFPTINPAVKEPSQIWDNFSWTKQYQIPINQRYQELCRTLKVDVNQFLFPLVPGTMTIDQFQTLSTTIHDMILQLYQNIMKKDVNYDR